MLENTQLQFYTILGGCQSTPSRMICVNFKLSGKYTILSLKKIANEFI
jgi:hypothetical protein